MIVLSLFDGLSCGRLAMEKAGFFVTRYFSSEIDKHAIKVVKAKWPDTICIGDVSKVRYKNGILYTENGEYRVGRIDAIIGGSPCQGFSSAGKGLNFEDPRSKLFFEYERILNEVKAENPNVIFLLENVVMKLEHQRIITERLGVEPIEIDSALVSAQTRARLYWTNIATEQYGMFDTDIRCTIPQPADRKIFLKDILQPEKDVDKKYYFSKATIRKTFKKTFSLPEKDVCGVINNEGVCQEHDEKSNAIIQTYGKGMDNKRQRSMVLLRKNGGVRTDQDKASCLHGSGKNCGNHSDMDVLLYQKPRGKNEGGFHQDKSPTMSSNSWQQNNVLLVPEATEKGYAEIMDGESVDLTHLNSKTRRGRKMSDKCNALVSTKHAFALWKNYKLRRYTPIECCRLQCVPDDYFFVNGKQIISDSQIYRQLGNGWNVDTIAYIFSFIKL